MNIEFVNSLECSLYHANRKIEKLEKKLNPDISTMSTKALINRLNKINNEYNEISLELWNRINKPKGKIKK